MKNIINPIALATLGVALCNQQASGSAVQWTVASGGNGHWYQAVPLSDGLSWQAAAAKAHSQGGYLVDILSASENSFVAALIDSPIYWSLVSNSQFVLADGPWIGAYQVDNSVEPNANFVWESTGNPLSYTNWNPGEPNDFQGEEDHVKFFTGGSTSRSDLWNDSNGQNVSSYVVEYDVDPNPRTSVPDSGSSLTLMGLACGGLALARRRSHR